MAFDKTVDLLVVGSGAGALVAAVRAAQHGAEVLVVEKGALWGGTSATSGGGIWIPGSHIAARDGQVDDLDEAYGYVRALTAPNVADEQVRSYVTNAARMLEWAEAKVGVGYAALPYPDYYPEVAGSREGYRTHLPLDFHAREMDRAAFDTMQRASPAASLWGKINWNIIETHTVLFRPKGWIKTVGKVLAGYYLDIGQRMRSPRDRRLTLGVSLLGRLRNALDATGTPLWLKSPLTSLIEEGGRIVGAVVRHDGKDVRVGVRKAVILGAGGFERNPVLRRQHLTAGNPAPEASGSQANNTGDMLIEAERHGAATRNLDSAWWAPVFRFPGEERSRLSTIERALPHSLIVDGTGRRYANEALSYHRFGEVMIAAKAAGTPTDPSWIIFDSRYRSAYPMGPVIPGIPDWALSGEVKSVLAKADSIEALAAKIKVPAATLAETVERFNAFALAGKDEDFGRGDAAYDRLYGDPRHGSNSTLGAVDKAPFYAVPLYLGDIGTNGGIVTDGRARVLRDDGSTIPGLYAVGNCAASVMGYSYPGAGATLGPAMTFGYLAAADAMGINAEGAAG